MNPIRHKVTLLIAIFIFLGSVEVAANEAAESPAPAQSGVVAKVEKAVERGAKAAARGVKRGVNAAARGVEHGAKATDNAAHRVARKISGSPAPNASSDK